MKSFITRTVASLALLAVFAGQAATAIAGTSGGVAGIVTDAKTGKPIAGVKLELSSPSQTATTTTDANGHYIVFSLQPDDYTITLQKDGYVERDVAGYTVSADQTQRYDLQLTPVPSQSP